MKRLIGVMAAVIGVAVMARGETVQTRDGPVECWQARAGAAGVVCVASNGIHTIPWARVTDERFSRSDVRRATVGVEWYELVAENYAEIDGRPVRCEKINGNVMNVLHELRGVLVNRGGSVVVAIVGLDTEGLVDGQGVSTLGLRDGEYKYVATSGAAKTVARYRSVPTISREAFCRYPESSFVEIAGLRVEARKRADDARCQAAEVKEREAREYARRMGAAERARKAELHERYRMK